jgi:hypothetical protein
MNDLFFVELLMEAEKINLKNAEQFCKKMVQCIQMKRFLKSEISFIKWQN